MNVSAWSIRNPIPAVMLFVLLTFGGLLSFNAMKVQNFPDIDLPTVTVSAALPGAAPGKEAVTLTVGRSMSGKFCTFIALKDSMPAKVSSTNSITAGMGFLIDQEETFIMAFCYLFGSNWCRCSGHSCRIGL